MGTEPKYKILLQKLLPRGKAWIAAQIDGSTLWKLLQACALEFDRVEQRGKNLFDEVDPRTTSELLPEWERVTALPDETTGVDPTFQQRRSHVNQKLTLGGGQDRFFFERIAEAFGFTIQVSSYKRFQAGRSRAGDPLTNDLWDHWFLVEGPATLIQTFKAGEGKAGEPLRTFGNNTVELTILKLKPANASVIFKFE